LTATVLASHGNAKKTQTVFPALPARAPGAAAVSGCRMVFVMRRFWPLTGGAARTLADLAAALKERDFRVTVLTCRWQPSWSAEIACRDVRVSRIAEPPRDARSTRRYTAALARWFRQHRGEYDLVYVSSLRQEARAAIEEVGGRAPVVLRAEASGPAGDCLWQLDAPRGRRIRRCCAQADALIAPSRLIERELIAAGYPRERIHYIPHGVKIPPAHDEGARDLARATMAEHPPGLIGPVWAPRAVYAGPLRASKGLDTLIEAWAPLVTRWPNARLWILGEGPRRKVLDEQIAARGLSGRVLLPGVFDRIDVPLAAADLFVLPALEGCMPVALLEAMAAGLPVVASDLAGHRELVAHNETGLLFPPGLADALTAAMTRLIDDPPLGKRLGAAARRVVAERYSLTGMVERHLEIFTPLVQTLSGSGTIESS